MHIYAFGSICRGEVDGHSDFDVLAIVGQDEPRPSLNRFSVYQYKRIGDLWSEGHPFAWHLFIEAKAIFFGDGQDFLASLGQPGPYRKARADVEKLYEIFALAYLALQEPNSTSRSYDLGTVFLAIRNVAISCSLAMGPQPDFSRRAALRIGSRSLAVSTEVFEILERARILGTRGAGVALTDAELKRALEHMPTIDGWMRERLTEARAL